MSYFQKAVTGNDYVFVAEINGTDYGQVVLVLQKPLAGETITLEDALQNSHNAGSFVFVKDKISYADTKAANEFQANITAILTGSSFTRALIWLTNSQKISLGNASVLGFTNTDYSVVKNFDVKISGQFSISIPAKVKLEVSNTPTPRIALHAAGNKVLSFLGPRAVLAKPILNASLSMSGPDRGTFLFNSSVTEASFVSNFKPGFQFLFSPYAAPTTIVSEFFPLMPPGPVTSYWNFAFQVDPVNVFNTPLTGTYEDLYNSRRTFFTLLPMDSGDPVLISSFYRTVFNESLSLQAVSAVPGLPSRFVFTQSKTSGADDFIVSPEGDFIIRMDNPVEGKFYQFLCSISGTEYISFMPYSVSYPGDRVTFISGQPAYLDSYPLPQASPTGPPVQPDRDLLRNDFSTAYAYLLRHNNAGNCHYVSQPKGMEMYGYDSVVHQADKQNPLGFIELGFALPASVSICFPLVPYAAIKPGDGIKTANAEQILNIEWTVIFPKRRREISKVVSSISLSSHKSLHGAAPDPPPLSSATPTGQVAFYEPVQGGAGDVIKEFILGRTIENNVTRKISFSQPGIELTGAMMTKDLFLVIANSKYLGTLNNTGDPLPGPSFNNSVQVENWFFDIKPGSNTYGNYSNVMIIKGMPGVLYDSAAAPENWLISSPDKWTEPGKFAAPSTIVSKVESEPDPSQLSALTQWLIDFFKKCSGQTDELYYQDLLEKAASPTWTGVLILRADINYQNVPDGLAPLLSGIANPENFKAHHIGITLSQIEKAAQGPDMTQASAVFGLINYQDNLVQPAGNGPVQPVIAKTSSDYDFRVLTLKVLFSNSSVKAFENYSQLIINKLFNMPVSGMNSKGNALNAIIIRGLYQKRNGIPYYSLDAIDKYAYYFDNNLFRKIEISSASLFQKRIHDDGSIESAFNLNGCLDFAILKMGSGEEAVAVDLLSFGSSDADRDGSADDKGLSYTNLGIVMTSPPTGANALPTTYFLDSSGLSFDIATSTIRENSLYKDFALNIYSWINAENTYKPEEYGYFGVVTELNLNRLPQGENNYWYGIEYKLDLGSPGELAGEAGLDAFLLLAWAPGSKGDARYDLFVGLKLPGLGGSTKIIDLQNVLKLSVGQSKLLYVPAVEGQPPKHFMLLLTDIALKFMGVLKIPPNGSTNFYLFGNKTANNEPSSLGWYAFYKKDTA